MQRSHMFLSVLVMLSLAFASCADDASDSTLPEPVSESRLGLDESIQCPAGEVGWRFPKKPVDKNSEQYVQQSGESSVVEITERYAIEPQQIRCNDQATDEARELRNQCGGSVSCSYTPSCSGSFSVTYSCGVGDTNADGSQKTYTASTSSGSAVDLDCTRPAEEALEVETRTACVPAQCHGRARRNLDMECVQDARLLDVVMRGDFNQTYEYNGEIEVDYDRYPIREWYPSIGNASYYTTRTLGGTNTEFIFPGLPYYIGLWADFWFGLVPEQSSVVAWMSDVYKSESTGETVEAFRCIAFKKDIVPEMAESLGEDVRFDLSYRGKMTESCTDGGRVSEDTAAKKLGISVTDFRQQYSYHHSRLRGSYDMAGNAVWHKVNKFRWAFELEELAYHEPECSPNPQDFYYDATTGTYDLVSYYAQREFATPRDVYFIEPSVGRKAYILPGEIKASGNLTIRTASRLNASLPVDISWDTANMTDENPFNPFVENVEIGGAWEPGKSLPAANFGPKNLRASVFVYPWARSTNRDLYQFKIGEVPLGEMSSEGATESVNLPITETVKRYFTRSPSKAYVEGDSRLFRLFYCIESDDDPRHSGDAFKSKKGLETYFPANADFAVREYEQNYVMTESSSDPSKPPFSLTLDTARDARFANASRGCRSMSRPLRVSIDRFTTPVEPIASSGFTGSTDNESTGDKKMSGENDNDTEINCEGDAQQECVEVVQSGNRTGGESGRSNYDLNSRLGRDPGNEASSGMTAEMIGFQLIDPMDPETSSVNYPADSSGTASTPVTITLAPDWDGIREALEFAATGSVTKWETRDYGGQMGLGVGWGYKWRFQIGVPVLVTFTFSVGASVSVDVELQFAPTAEQAYPCIGTDSCVVKVSQPASLRDAARECNVKGGRLAELSSQIEANAVDAARGTDEVWLGGQLAYRHDKPSCATNYVASECLSRSQTEYRWMSNSVAFAKHFGDANPDYNSDELFNAVESGLRTSYPYNRGITYKSDGSLGTLGVESKRPYICAFEPASKENFLRWQLALNMGAAAGFSLVGCTPDENPGFCLGASFNVVSFSIGPVYENIYHWLYRAGEDSPHSKRGNTNISVPWALKLFTGAVTASVNFLWFTIQWNLVSYDGITAAEGKLYDVDTPVIESLR